MKGIVSFFIVLILVLLAILPTMVLAALSRPLPAPIEIVINTNDAGPGSLRQALLDVDGGGTVRFGPGLLESTIHLSSTLTVNKSLTIDGESRNVTISGDSDDDGVGNVRVFQIHSANAVTITRLTIEKGASSDLYVGGGGILNGGRLTVIDCTLAKNSAASSGGGIANSSFAQTIVIGSLFFGNSSSQQGGGMYNSGYGDPLTIIDSSFSDNSASGMGGGIFSYSSAITGSTFISNSAAYGGGLHVMGPTTIANSTIISNSVSHWGGGIRNDEQDLPVLVSNSTIAYNRAGIKGGGIFGGNSASMSVYNSTISGNSAVAGYGGGIANEAGGTFIVVNTTFSGNSAPIGGGISSRSVSRLYLTNNIIANSPDGGDCDNQGTIETNINNLVQDGSCDPAFSGDPDLGPLMDNGAFRQTHALRPGSLAIDAGSPSACIAAPIDNLDQRGIVRPVDGDGDGSAICDVGAFEFRPPDPTIDKQAYPDPVQPGAQLTYTIDVTYVGDVAVTATITDVLPGCVVPTGFLTWTADFPMLSGVWTTEFSVTVGLDCPGPLINVVRVGADQGATGVYTETSAVWAAPNLTVTKQASHDPALAGEALTYTIRVTNTGNVPLTATITDTLPDHVTTTQPFVWPSQVISAPGGVWTTDFSVVVEVGYAGLLTNVVQVSSEQGVTGAHQISTIAVAPPRIVKSVTPTGRVEYGAELTYTLFISAATGARIRLYDLLDGTTFIRFAGTPTGITHSNGVITGTLMVTPTHQITVSFVVQVEGPGNSVDNRACVYPFDGMIRGDCTWSNEATNPAFRYSSAYLPLIFEDYPAAPDLVVQSMTATLTDVQVVIKNQGSRPVNDEFWVDVYIDPDPVPTAVNQIWSDGRSEQGIVWGVEVSALPLKPGDALTLTIGDVYYWDENSYLSAELATGTPLYAQVDSANPDTFYGGVLEAHEITGGVYNNITGPVFPALAFNVIDKGFDMESFIYYHQRIQSRNLQVR